jgi:hypothetical protein
MPRPLSILTILLTATLWCAATPPPLPVITTTTKPLVWGPSPTPGITRYRLYHSTNDLTWHTNYLVTGTNYLVTVQAGSTNWFMVRAVNVDGIESDPSNVYEQPIQPKPAPAGSLQVVPVTTSIQTRTPAGEWTEVRRYTNNIIEEPEPGRLFRSALGIGAPIELVRLK